MPFGDAAEYASRLSKADRAQFWIDQSAPPPVRRRKREARRWIDLLTAMCVNPPDSFRRPGDGWLTVREGLAIRAQAHARLHLLDRELWSAVKRIEWDDGERVRGMTIDQWRADVSRHAGRRKRAREEVCRYGIYPLSRDQMWKILGVPTRKATDASRP